MQTIVSSSTSIFHSACQIECDPCYQRIWKLAGFVHRFLQIFATQLKMWKMKNLYIAIAFLIRKSKFALLKLYNVTHPLPLTMSQIHDSYMSFFIITYPPRVYGVRLFTLACWRFLVLYCIRSVAAQMLSQDSVSWDTKVVMGFPMTF